MESEVKTEGAEESSTPLEKDPYFYTKRDFTSENFKIEIGNLPRYIGFGQMKKFLNSKMKLSPRKVKAIGTPITHFFVTFKNEEDRDKALNCLSGYEWKGKELFVKIANPAADPYVAKRKAGESEEAIPSKKAKFDEDFSTTEILKNSVTPYWNIPYEEQLKKKDEEVQQLRKQLQKEIRKVYKQSNKSCNNWGPIKVEPIKPSPITTKYRSKCEFSIGRDLMTKEKTVGFRLSKYKDGSMSVSAPDECINISDVMINAAKSFQQYIQESDKDVYNAETHCGYWRQLTVRTTRNNDVLLIIVMHPQQLTQEELEKEKTLLRKYFEKGLGNTCGVTSVYFQLFDKKRMGDDIESNIEHLLGKTHMEETLLGMTFQISPEAFFQVNIDATEVLFRTIAEEIGLTESTTVFDICCGTGTIGLFLAKSGAQVIGIEMCSQAIDNAIHNAQLNNITNARYLCGKAEEEISIALTQSTTEDITAVVDPPRAGLHPKVVKIIRATENLKRLIYVSCNPKSAFTNFVDLCRPMSKNFKGEPFFPVKLIPIDFFPQTPHYELVMVFER